MERILDLWLRWPIAARWTSGIGILWVVLAAFPALRASHPAAAFGENFVALGIHYGLMAAGLAIGVWAGRWVAERTGKAWLGWTIGIAVFGVVSLAQFPLGDFFGVSSRLDEMFNSDCYVDWDGRSNPTACD